MKKFLLLTFTLMLTVMLWAKSPHGFLPEALEKDSIIYDLWDVILANKPISVKLVLPYSQEDKRAEYENIVRNAFTSWFSDSAKIIRQSAREQEMADVLPVLDMGLDIRFGTEQGYKIIVYIYESINDLQRNCKNDKALGCASGIEIHIPTPEVIREVRPNTPANINHTLAHEFGHMLGFSDQYIEGIVNDIDEAAPRYESSLAYVSETVMSGSDAAGKIGCDDTDGIIKMIDTQRGGQRGARKGKAWKSFCKDSKDYFLNGKRIRKELYHIRKSMPMQGVWGVDLGQGEKQFSIDLNAPLSPDKLSALKEQILTKDIYGRPTKTKGSNGEIIYYENFQGVTRKAAFIKGNLSWVEITYQDRLSKEYFHQLYFGGAGKLSLMEWSKPSHFYYEEGFYPYNPKAGYYGMELSCNGNNCKFIKDNFTQYDPFSEGNVSPFLGKINFNVSPEELKISANLIREKVKGWFKALPDK